MTASPKQIVITSVLLTVFLVGCNERKETEKWITSTGENLTAARAQMGGTPYRAEQQNAFKAYFFGLAESVLKLKQDPKHAQSFNKAFRQLDVNAVCDRTLIARSEWAQIARNCMRNRFFVCAEEVRAYPEIMNSFIEHLTPDNKALFEKAPACSRAITE